MTTQPVQSNSSGNKLASNKMQLRPQDFIKLMITQLQHQDPTQPAKNEELLAQMSQIGQLQSSTDLQASLKGLVLQNSLGSAGNMIGKMVVGMDDKNETVNGLVNSVRVEDGQVYLELDSGKTLKLGNVTSISPGPSGIATTPGTSVAGAQNVTTKMAA